MKLQVKDSGAWRNVLSFEPAQRLEVEFAAAALMRAAGCSKTTLRISDGDQALAYCETPACAWRSA